MLYEVITVGDLRLEMPKGLPFRLTDYLELVEFTGRILVITSYSIHYTKLYDESSRLMVSHGSEYRAPHDDDNYDTEKLIKSVEGLDGSK